MAVGVSPAANAWATASTDAGDIVQASLRADHTSLFLLYVQVAGSVDPAQDSNWRNTRSRITWNLDNGTSAVFTVDSSGNLVASTLPFPCLGGGAYARYNYPRTYMVAFQRSCIQAPTSLRFAVTFTYDADPYDRASSPATDRAPDSGWSETATLAGTPGTVSVTDPAGDAIIPPPESVVGASTTTAVIPSSTTTTAVRTTTTRRPTTTTVPETTVPETTVTELAAETTSPTTLSAPTTTAASTALVALPAAAPVRGGTSPVVVVLSAGLGAMLVALGLFLRKILAGRRDP